MFRYFWSSVAVGLGLLRSVCHDPYRYVLIVVAAGRSHLFGSDTSNRVAVIAAVLDLTKDLIHNDLVLVARCTNMHSVPEYR